MGRLKNALKRAVGIDSGESALTKIKKPFKALKTVVILIIVFVLIIASFPAMLGVAVSDWVADYKNGISASSTSASTPSSTATSVQSVEDIVRSGGTINVSEESKKDMMLENYGFEDLVNGTLNPFGVEGDGDERFKDITIKTERKMRVRTHPSDSEITAYRTSTRASMWAEKEAAYSAAVSAAATPSVTDTPTGTAAPTGTSSPTSAPTPPPAPTPKTNSSASPGSIPVRENSADSEDKIETFAGPADPYIGIVDGGGGIGGTTRTPSRTPSRTPTGTSAVSLSVTVTTAVTGSGTPPPSVTGTNAPSPTSTPTPIPTPTWTEDDEKALEKAVSDWIAANSKEEDKTDYVETVLSGEQLRRYMNSFHMPWQVNYCMASYLELYELNIGKDEELSIGEEAIKMAFSYGNMLSYSLVINFWDGTWDGKEVKYDDRESVLGRCRIDTSADHTSSPVKLDDNTDIISEEGFYPIVLFNSINGWATNNIYGERLDTINDYGYYNQVLSRTEMSKAFDNFFGYTDMGEPEIMIFTNGLEAMPEPEKFSAALLVFEEMFEPGAYVGGHIDLSAFTHLAAGSQGEQSVYMALEIVDRGATYSQGNRYGSNSYDCSSLVNRVYKDLGIDLSWGGDTSTNGLAHYFVEHSLVVCNGYDESQMQPGDVILWSKPSRTDHYLCVYHAGIYAGNGWIVDASYSRGHVVYREMWGQSEVVLVARPSAGMGDAAGLGAIGYVNE